MVSLGLVILILIVVFVSIIFFAGLFLDFIQPSAIQIQILGVHLTLFGLIVALSFDNPGYGVAIGHLRRFIGCAGFSFQIMLQPLYGFGASAHEQPIANLDERIPVRDDVGMSAIYP